MQGGWVACAERYCREPGPYFLSFATNRRAGLYQSSQKFPKEVYSFKSQVGRRTEGLVATLIPEVAVYVPPKGSKDGAVYVRVGEVQFSFHAISRAPTLERNVTSGANREHRWSGHRPQPIVPACGRAVFVVEGTTDELPEGR